MVSIVCNVKCDVLRLNYIETLKGKYSWIACQLQVGRTLTCLLSRSDFKSETSFGFLSANYTGQSTWFCCTASKWPRLTSHRVGGVFQGVLGTKSALWAQIIFLVSQKHTTSVNLVCWISTKSPLITKLSLVHVSTVLSSARRSAWLP